ARVDHRVRGRFVDRQMRAASEIAFLATDAAEPTLDSLDMHWLAAVRRACERQLIRRDREGVGAAGFDESQRLERLEGGARVNRGVDIAPAREDAALGVADRDRAAMGTLDPATARHFDKDGVHDRINRGRGSWRAAANRAAP